MTATELLTIIAILLGPIGAVQAEKFLTRQRDIRNRKLTIFKTLMATRGSTLSFQHVESLNRIDLEFQGNKYLNVVRAWKEYFDHLCTEYTPEHMLANSVEILERRQDFLAKLLLEMGKSLGYDFDMVLIKRNAYLPKGHLEIENQNDFIRKGMIKMIEGKLSLPISIEAIQMDDENKKVQERQVIIQELLIEYYRHENKRLAEQKDQNQIK